MLWWVDLSLTKFLGFRRIQIIGVSSGVVLGMFGGFWKNLGKITSILSHVYRGLAIPLPDRGHLLLKRALKRKWRMVEG